MSKKIFFAFIILFLVNLFFFAKFYFQGLYPFPGDLLLAEYNPWRQSSFFGFAPGAIPNKAQSFDTLVQLYPWRHLAIRQLKQGQWPLWNPYNFSGTPLLANFQSAAFYPLNFLYFLVDFNLAWATQVILQPLLASFFFYLFARQLKISFQGSLLGAIVFGYSSFMTVWLEYNTIGHVILWLPLILLSIEKLINSQTQNATALHSIVANKWSVIFILSLTCSFLAGHFQDFGFVFLFSFLYFLFRSKQNTNRKLLILWLAPFLLGALQLLPGLELIFHSARSALDSQFLRQKVLLQPWQLIFTFVPDFFGNPATRNYFLEDTYIGKVLYIGLLPSLFSLLTLFKRKDPLKKFFLFTAGLTLFLSLNSPFTGFLHSLPIFSSLSPTRILFLCQFSLSLLAAFGFDLWQQKKVKPTLALKLVGGVFLIAWLFASGKFGLGSNTFLANLSVVRRNLLYSTSLLIISAGLLFLGQKKATFSKAIIWLIIIFVSLDLFRFFSKITPFSPPEFIFPQVKLFDFLQGKNERFWGYGTAAISPNYNLIYQTFSPDGYDPLYPRWYGEYIRLSEEGTFKRAIRSNAQISPGFGKEDFPQNKSRQKILASLSVAYLLDRDENQSDETTFPSINYPPLWQEEGWRVYENKMAAPRAFLAEKVYFAQTKKEFEKIFQDPDFYPASQVILSTKLPHQDTISPGKIEEISIEPNQVRLKVDTQGPGILVLTDTDYPGWKALVDGTKTKVFRANHALKAIQVPLGNHHVEFIYQPFFFRFGLAISLLSLGGWLFCVGLTIMKRKGAC